MARSKAIRWYNVVAGLLAGTAAFPLVAAAQPQPVVSPPAMPSAAEAAQGRAAVALQSASQSLSRGDLDAAAAHLRQAALLQSEMTTAQKQDLLRLQQSTANQLAGWQQAHENLLLAEKAYAAGQTKTAGDVYQRVLADEKYLSAGEKTRLQTLGQKLNARPGKPSAPAAPAAVGGGNEAARVKLREGRQMLAQGLLDGAEAKAREAEKAGATFGKNEDSPAKLRDDVSRLKADPKGLLTMAHSAFKNRDLERAENLARASEKASSTFTFAFSSDTPTALLAQIQATRAKAGSPPTQTATRPTDKPVSPIQQAGYNPAKDTTAVKPASTTPATTAPAPKPAPTHNVELQKARALVEQGRKAFQAGDHARARLLAEQARSLKAPLEWWEDTPEKVLADVLRSEGQADKVAIAQNEPPRNPEDPRALLRQGRAELADGKIEDATKTMVKVKAMNVRWSVFEDTPDSLRNDIERARTRRDREESVKVLADARKLYAQGDFDGASAAAYKAMKLHGEYSMFDTGDRPQKLLSEIQLAKTRRPKTTPADPVVVKNDQTPPAPVGPKPMPTKPAEDANATLARSYLAEARKALGKNDVATATTLARQVERMGVKFDRAGEDTPQAVLMDAEIVVKGGRPSGVVQVSGTTPAAPTNANKEKAKALVGEAQQFVRAGKLLEARQKAVEAQRLGVVFAPNEDSPEQALLQLNLVARRQVDLLVTRATEAAAQGFRDVAGQARAEQDLAAARQLAAGFGHDTQPIDAKMEWVRNLKGGVKPAGGTAVAQGPPVPVGLPPVGPSNPGRDLLFRSRQELRAGQTAAARKLAEQAFQGNFGVQDEALAVLRSIDGEEMNQKRLESFKTFDAAVAAFNRNEHAQAGALIAAIDSRLLDEPRKQRLKEIQQTPQMGPVAQVRGPITGDPTKPVTGLPTLPSLDKSPLDKTPADGGSGLGSKPGAGIARLTDTGAESSILAQVQAMREVKFDQVRKEGLAVQQEASEKFRSGQTDAAMEMLSDYLGTLDKQDLDPSKIAMLRRPVDSRLKHFQLLVAQKQLRDGSKAETERGFKAVKDKRTAEENKQKLVVEQMKRFNECYRDGKYLEAESFAMRASELDPDNPMAGAAIQMARTQRKIKEAQDRKNSKNEFAGKALDDAETLGAAAVSVQNPYLIDEDRFKQSSKRTPLGSITKAPRKTAIQREIESRLNTPVSLNFENTKLGEALNDIRQFYTINIVPDTQAMEQEGISLDRPVRLKVEHISLKSALNLLLKQVKLTYVIRDEVLEVTTEQNAKGNQVMVVYQVADLVTAVQDSGSLGPRGTQPTLMGSQTPTPGFQPPTPINPAYGLQGGAPVGSPTGSTYTPGGEQSAQPSWQKKSSQTMEDMLIKLITNTVAPNTWNNAGGPGTVDYYPLTMSLTISQTPDIQEQVADLLQALRRLQDQQVAVEVRFVSIAEEFYERIGLDFNMVFKTNQHTRKYEPDLISGTFGPPGYINDPSFKGLISGLTPAGALTGDLDVPLRQGPFNASLATIPQFGGYNGGLGGIGLGLAYLSDIQVFLFLDAAQGDRRTNVMQAPKLTLFNGQTATLGVFDQQSFVTGVALTQLANGNFAFIPQTSSLPLGTNITIRAIIGADRRSVRLDVTPQIQNLVPGTIQLFPVVVPIYFQSPQGPGDPVTFTQFIQQPVFNSLQIQTTVSVPDGGTVLMGGFKRLAEVRNEIGPPVLSKIPYINRLFKNVGYGRDAASLLIMVTPRIIIQEEEEFLQTGYSPTPSAAP